MASEEALYRDLSVISEAVDLVRPEPAPVDAEAVLRDLQADPNTTAGRLRIHNALRTLQALSTDELLAFGTEIVDGIVRTFALAAFDLSDDREGLATVVAGLATVGVHLDWRSGGAEFLSSLSPETRAHLQELVEYVDTHLDAYGGFGRDVTLYPVLTSSAGDQQLSMGQIFDHLLQQAERAGSGSSANLGPISSSSSEVRALAIRAVQVAEMQKASALAELRSGELTQSRIMELQEQLQTANQIIEAFNQIMRKEDELMESLIRNIA